MAPSLQSILSTSSSPMGRVEKATSRLLMGPDLMINLDICDSVNSNPWQAKAFVKAVKKRLQNKNSRVQFLALTLLESMIKHCGDFVHFQVVDLGILQEMVKIVRKARNMQVREKILVLLEFWQEAFGGPDGKYPQYYYTYAELKRSGVRFRQNQRDGDLVLTSTTPITNQPQVGYGMPSNSIERLDEVMASEASHFSFTDLANIRGVTDLFNNMLHAVNPKDHGAIKDEVITDLANQCRINQKRLMHLISRTDIGRNDGLLREALAMNDNLQIVLSKHEALVYGSNLPTETSLELPRQSASAPVLSSAMGEQFDDKEEEEDGFSYLAKRNSMFKSTGDQEVSLNKNGINTAISSTSATDDASSIASNALIVFDPQTPVGSSKVEGDMIDLQSPTLSENQPPQTDLLPLPPSPSNQSQNPFFDSTSWEKYHNYPQPFMSNEGYTSYNTYMAPWAQPAVGQFSEPSPVFPQQLPQNPNDCLPTTWTAPRPSLNPFLSTASTQTQYIASQPSVALGSAVTVTVQGSKSLESFNSFGSKETQLNFDLKVTGPSSAPKQYMPDNLFEDLIKLRNPDGSLKSRNASSLWGFSGEGVTSVN